MPTNYVCFLDRARHFNSNKGFSILILNIVDLNSRIDELKCILNSGVFYIIVLNETKIDEETPDSFFANRRYNNFRRDRKAGEGGILVYCRKEYKIIKHDRCT